MPMHVPSYFTQKDRAFRFITKRPISGRGWLFVRIFFLLTFYGVRLLYHVLESVLTKKSVTSHGEKL